MLYNNTKVILIEWWNEFASLVFSEDELVYIQIYVCLFVCLFLYVHSTIFQLCGTVLPGFNQY